MTGPLRKVFETGALDDRPVTLDNCPMSEPPEMQAPCPHRSPSDPHQGADGFDQAQGFWELVLKPVVASCACRLGLDGAAEPSPSS